MSDERELGPADSRDDLSTPAPDPHSWAAGQIVARRYMLERLLGGGSTGEVWLAEDRLLRKSVALKVLQRELAQSRETVHRFLREVALAHSVTHPNVVRIYDTGEESGMPFFTMEFLQGQTLEELLDQDEGRPGESLPFPEIRQIAFDVLDGMEAAHRVGVVHRDLKPGNVMLTHRGAIVMDFGVAGIEEVSEAPNAASVRSLVNTEAGTIFGSPAYMAPELWEGAPATVQSDLYAFGVMIYQMLTGRLPYDAPSPAAYLQKLNEGPPPSVRGLRRDTPWSLVRLVRRCMAQSPQDRPPSAAATTNLIAPFRDKARRRAVIMAALIVIGSASAYAARRVPTHDALGLPDPLSEADLSAAARMFDVGDSGAALRTVERVLRRAPDSAAAHFWQAMVLEDLGDHAARQHRCGQVDSVRGDPEWIRLAQAACGPRFLGDPTRLATSPRSALFPVALEYMLVPELEASSRTAAEDDALHERARAALEHLESPAPAGPWTLPIRSAIARIDLELALGRAGEAVAHLHALTEHEPSAPIVQERAAWLALHEGNLDRAHAFAVSLRPIDRATELHYFLLHGQLRRAWEWIEAAPGAPQRQAWIELWCGFAWRFEAMPPPPQCRVLFRGLAAAAWNPGSAGDSVLEDAIIEHERIDACRRHLDPPARITHAPPPFELRLGELAIEAALCSEDAAALDRAQNLATRLAAIAPANPWLSLLHAELLDARGKPTLARNQRLAVAELWSHADRLPRVERLRELLSQTAQ